MRKLLALTVVMVFLLGFAGVAGAMSDDGLCESPAFTGSEGHWTHDSGAPRFDTKDFRMAVPGEGATNANLEESVLSRPGDTLVDPLP